MDDYDYRSLEPANQTTTGRSQAPSIRLLELLPGASGDAIHCKLSHESLTKDVNYEALSYTWGSPTRSQHVMCSGHRILVTDTLQEALSALRYEKTKRTLWIDQLCINQEDVNERNGQVKIMHLIYKNASRTIVFLGSNGAPALHLKLSRLRLLREMRRPYEEGKNEGSLLKEIQSLFHHPWFQRVWILQEIGMSELRKVIFMYRSSVFTWDEVRGAATLLGSYSPGHKYEFIQLQPSAIRHTMLMAKWTAMGPGSFQFPVLDRYGHLYFATNKWFYSFFLLAMEPRLVETLQDSRFCYATDPRDKVYSLLNMLQIDPAKDKFAHHLTVDYSVSVTELYTRAARYCIETEHSLEVLCYKEGAPKIPDMPSWTPDWTQQTLFPIHRIAVPTHFRSQFHLDAGLPRGVFPPLHRARNQASITTFSAHGKILTVTGLKLDTIATLSSIWPFALDVPDLHLFQEWASIYTDNRASELTSLPFKPEIKPRGLKVTSHSICDFWLRVGRHPRLKASDTPHPFETEWRRSPYHRHRIDRGIMLHRRGNMAFIFYKDWLAMMLPYASIGRRVATTEDGYFLLVPPETLEGDAVYFLDGGGSLVYMLRETAGSQGTFELVGAAYVHGFYGTDVRGMEGTRESVNIR